MADLPTGTVTFLVTDIAGTTRWEQHREAMYTHVELQIVDSSRRSELTDAASSHHTGTALA